MKLSKTVEKFATTKTTMNIIAQNRPKTKDIEPQIQKLKKKKARKDKTAGLSFTLVKSAISGSQQKPDQLKLVASKPTNSKNSSQSASQKRNGLLQLANALKSKTNQSSSNKTQERLQKMFK